MHAHRRRLATTAVASAAITVALVGCSGAGGSDAITYWGAFSSTDTEQEFTERFIDTFNADSETAVKMDVKQLTNLAQLTDTAVSAGRGPDIVYSSGPSSALGFANADRTASLDDYASEYGWADLLQPWAYEASLVDGELRSVPVSYGSVVMYYNPQVFDEHGWEVPTTAEEFAEVAADAKSKGLIPVGAGNSGYTAQSEWYLTAVLNAAVGPQKLHEVLSGDAAFDDAEFVDAITTFQEQIQAGWWGGSPDRWFTNTDTDMFAGLAAGDVAMYMTGTWSFGSAATFFGEEAGNDAEWDWAPLPSLSDAVEPGVFPLAIGTSLGINSASEKSDGAAAFINSMIADADTAYGYTEATGENPPPLVDVEAIPAGLDPRVARLYSGIPESTNLGYASWTFFPPATDTYLYTEFDKVITGDMTPKQYLAGLQDVFADELASGKVPTPFAPEAP